MPNARDAQRKRLDNGLTVDQNLILQELTMLGNWKQACDRAGVSYERFRTWIKRDEAFRKAFEELNAGAVESVRRQLEGSSQRAAEAFDDALEATKDVKIKTECPECHAEIELVAEVPDHATRLKSAEVILKVNKVLKDVKEVEGRITVAALPLHLQLALAAWRRGDYGIPPGYRDQLIEYGMIKALPPGRPDVEEAEYRVMGEEDDD